MIAPLARVLAVLLAGASLAFAQQPLPSAQRDYSIGGVVVSATDGRPLDQAVVTLSSSEDGVKVAESTTGRGGNFQFDHLKAGNYALRASRDGYNAASYEEHEGFFTGIITGPGRDTSKLRLKLQRSAVIGGVVTDDSGDAVRNAEVTLYRKEPYDGLGKITGSGTQRTNDIGAFEFDGLAPDEYFVSVNATPWYAVHRQPKFDAQGTVLPDSQTASPLDVAYPLTFYNGATDSDDATPIQLRAGEHLQLSLSLHAVPALHIRIHPQGEGERRRFVMAQITENVFGQQVSISGMTMFYGNGFAEISGVAPGHYQARFAEGQSSDLNLTNNTTLSAPPPDPGVEIRGKVAMADGEATPPFLYVGFNSLAGSFRRGVVVGKDGTFTTEAMPAGRYRVSVGGSGRPYSITGMAADEASIEGSVLKLGAASTNLAIVVTRDSATIKGYVSMHGKPGSGVMVVLVPHDPDANRALFRRDESNSDGSFSLRFVAPGAYTLVAIEDGWDMEWSRREVIARYLSRGSKINIAVSQTMVSVPQPIEAQPR